MAWSASKIFMACVTDALNDTANMNIDGDQIEAALFDNSITPSQTVASASTAYGAGVWASGGVLDASGWPAIGRPLGTIVSTFASNVYSYGAANTVSANSTTSLTNATGTLVYNNTIASPVAKQGICYNYFGGAQTIVSGTFTIAWSGGYIFQLTL